MSHGHAHLSIVLLFTDIESSLMVEGNKLRVNQSRQDARMPQFTKRRTRVESISQIHVILISGSQSNPDYGVFPLNFNRITTFQGPWISSIQRPVQLAFDVGISSFRK